MYGSDQYSMQLPRPFHVYIPQPFVANTNKLIPGRSELDDFALRQGLSQTSSTENSNENRAELLVPSEMRDFASCFSSYATLMPSTGLTAPPNASVSLSHVNDKTLQEPHFMHLESHVDRDGALHEEEHKHEREHRKRSKNWTRPETLRLIQARTILDAKFGRAGKKSELWDQIGDLLQKDGFSRDAQQCKDKWEKLSASYKEVRDGAREKEDFVFFDEMHALLSARFKKRERDTDDAMRGGHAAGHIEDVELDLSGEFGLRVDESPHFVGSNAECFAADTYPMPGTLEEVGVRSGVNYTVMNLRAVQELLDSYLAKQRTFFANLLDEVERREQLKEKLRQEREDRWRAEEREQRRLFTNAMIILTQRLLGEVPTTDFASWASSFDNMSDEQGGLKRRSKTWKRSEVLELIKVRTQMDSKFNMRTRRAELWEELAEALSSQGIDRDGKQCRETWDNLMAEFKDVVDGRTEQSESPYFMDLKTFMEEGHCNP